MDIRNSLITKYFVKEYDSETELYEALNNYRIECYQKGLSDDDSVVKYLNGYEILYIDTLLTSVKQTDEFKKWYLKVMNTRLIDRQYWGIKLKENHCGNFLTSDMVENSLFMISMVLIVLSICGILPYCFLIALIPLSLVIYNVLDK